MYYPAKRDVHTEAMELLKNRKEANEAILKNLIEYLRANPSVRFNQALANLDIVIFSNCHNKDNLLVLKDDYYTEPMDVLKRMK